MNRELENWQNRMPTFEECDREINRRFWRRKLKAVAEAIGILAFALLVVALFWLYLIATPDQMSAECERIRAQMEEASKTTSR